jgi:hypothetical protein
MPEMEIPDYYELMEISPQRFFQPGDFLRTEGETMNAALTHYLVFGPYVWGKATTEAEATQNMRTAGGGNTKSYYVYRCHPDTTVDGLGDFGYPSGKKTGQFAPVLVKRVHNNKEVEVTS